MKTLRTILAISLLSVPVAASALDPVYSSWRGLAIRGADPVAYFSEGRAVIGSPAFEYTWQGATWRFSSEEHRARFAADPERHAPQYGGYCAYAVSEGYTASIDPEAWKIVGGKLYLNYSRDVQKLWEADVPGRIARGDANWPGLLAGE